MYQILGLPRYPSMMKPWPQQWGGCCWQTAISSGHSSVPRLLWFLLYSEKLLNAKVLPSQLGVSLKGTNFRAPYMVIHLFSVYCHFCPPCRQVLGQRHYQINYLHTNSSQKTPYGTLRNLFRVQEQSWGFKPNYDSSPTPCCSTVLSATAADSQVPT